MTALLELTGLTRRFGGVTAVNDLALTVAEGELVSIIGPNGAGKTTVFNLVTGLDTPDAGKVRFDGWDITGLPAEELASLGLARTFQHGRVFGNLSVLDNVLVGGPYAPACRAAGVAGHRTDGRTGAGPHTSRNGQNRRGHA